MVKESTNEYGSFGSVPTATPTGVLNVHATPDEFGAQVGGAEQKLGAAGEQVGGDVMKYAEFKQGLINETAMTTADANFATKVGQIKAGYLTKTGMAAYNAFPQYQSDLQQAFNEARQGLPGGAQRGFDMVALRTMANHAADGSTYAAQQLKEANVDGYTSLANANMQSLLDPDVAKDKERSQFHLDSLSYAAHAQVDHTSPGLKTDPETGKVSFDESTPEGQQLKADTQRKQDVYLAQGYVNRFNTLAKQNVYSANEEYQQERDKMPKAAQVALDVTFANKLLGAHTQDASSQALNDADQKHWQILTNPSAASSIDTVLKNEGGLSKDGHAIYGIDKDAHPSEFAQAQKVTDEKGAAAGKEYAANFYKTEYYDKKDIASLPSATQSIVMDGVVNHSTQFGNQLIQAAKNGATPEQLIDMRRQEYQRLATENPDKYGQNLQGWNNRLDSFNVQSAAGQPKTYATNDNGAPLSRADYYALHKEDIFAKGDAYAEDRMPGDLILKRAVRQNLSNAMEMAIQNQHVQYTMDNRNVMRGINGELTNGKAPMTEQELRAVPGMGDLLDKVAYQDPKFAETIPTLIGKVAKRNDVTNSHNGYETVLRTLEPNDNDHPNRISSQDHLDKLLGRTDGTGINAKDYNDAKQAIEFDDTTKKKLNTAMRQIENANGNVDGNGSERALQWYNQAVSTYKNQKTAQGDKFSNAEFFTNLNDRLPPPMPSRIEQLNSHAQMQKAPEIGAVNKGYSYLGGDPSLPASWKKVQ